MKEFDVVFHCSSKCGLPDSVIEFLFQDSAFNVEDKTDNDICVNSLSFIVYESDHGGCCCDS